MTEPVSVLVVEETTYPIMEGAKDDFIQVCVGENTSKVSFVYVFGRL